MRVRKKRRPHGERKWKDRVARLFVCETIVSIALPQFSSGYWQARRHLPIPQSAGHRQSWIARCNDGWWSRRRFLCTIRQPPLLSPVATDSCLADWFRTLLYGARFGSNENRTLVGLVSRGVTNGCGMVLPSSLFSATQNLTSVLLLMVDCARCCSANQDLANTRSDLTSSSSVSSARSAAR